MAEVGQRIAADFATGNQVACSASRLVYVMCGTEDEDIEKLKQLGQQTYDAMLRLPEVISTKPKRYDPELKSQVDMLRLNDDFYTVIGGRDEEGAVLVSHTSDRVEFWEYLADRTINIIPVDTLDEVLDVVDAYTQTVGVWPEGLWGHGAPQGRAAWRAAFRGTGLWVQRRRAGWSAGRHRADAGGSSSG